MTPPRRELPLDLMRANVDYAAQVHIVTTEQ
jgi:hypothetical protein